MAPSDRANRAHYRIVFPARARPHLIIQDILLEVLDLSEGGLRFRFGGVVPPEVGNAFEGTIRFPSGDAAPVRGVITRASSRHAAARFELGVPGRVLRREQQAILMRPRGSADRG